MDDGELRLKQQTRGPTNDPLLDYNETAIESNKSCAKWNDSSCYKWGKSTLLQEHQIIQQGPLIFDPPPSNHEQNPNWTAKDPQANLLWWHHWLRPCSFKMLKALAEHGEIPMPLAKVQPPKCTGCLFGTLTRKASQATGASNKPIKVATAPGECISID